MSADICRGCLRRWRTCMENILQTTYTMREIFLYYLKRYSTPILDIVEPREPRSTRFAHRTTIPEELTPNFIANLSPRRSLLFDVFFMYLE